MPKLHALTLCSQLYGDAGEVPHTVNLHESAQLVVLQNSNGAPVVDNLTLNAGHIQHLMATEHADDVRNCSFIKSAPPPPVRLLCVRLV